LRAVVRFKSWQARGWERRQLARCRPGATIMAFAGSRDDVVALHVLRNGPSGSAIKVLFLTFDPSAPEIDAYFEELRIRWSLDTITAPVRSDAVGAQEPRASVWTNNSAVHAVQAAAAACGCDTVVTSWRRTEAAVPALLETWAEKPFAGLIWINPIWWYGEQDVAAYIDRFRLPVCSLHKPARDARTDNLDLGAEVLQRMRGLGYF
jgi:3'-phosphoadenosine 5'-phosphosulfate sulfotransferase (PAPS reductase)/FAD synthetase